MEHILHEKFSHKKQAFEAMVEEFKTVNQRNPDEHEKAKLLSDAICLWSKEEVDIKSSSQD